MKTTNPNPYADAIRTPQQIEENYRKAHDPKRTAQSEDNIVVGAWLTALFVPIVGFALGTILTTRQRETHGIWAMVVSTLSAVVWWAIIASLNYLAATTDNHGSLAGPAAG